MVRAASKVCFEKVCPRVIFKKLFSLESFCVRFLIFTI